MPFVPKDSNNVLYVYFAVESPNKNIFESIAIERKRIYKNYTYTVTEVIHSEINLSSRKNNKKQILYTVKLYNLYSIVKL